MDATFPAMHPKRTGARSVIMSDTPAHSTRRKLLVKLVCPSAFIIRISHRKSGPRVSGYRWCFDRAGKIRTACIQPVNPFVMVVVVKPISNRIRL